MELHPGILQSVVETVIYADIFDQPLTVEEIHRYLHGVRISPEDLEAFLEGPLPLIRTGKWFSLPGREALAAVRRAREARSAAYWDTALWYGRIIAKLPFVRMVGLTGALAVRNADDNSDIDYLIIAAHGRAWTCRLFVVALVKWAALRGVVLCPNYFLSENALVLSDRSIFTAHELAQMVPLSGENIYFAMRAANSWADELLPNASGPPHPEIILANHQPLSYLLERPLLGRFGDRLESWEMNRKIAKFRGEHAFNDETQFSADRVQGHFNSYRAKTLAEFNRRRLAASDPS